MLRNRGLRQMTELVPAISISSYGENCAELMRVTANLTAEFGIDKEQVIPPQEMAAGALSVTVIVLCMCLAVAVIA